MGSAFWNILLAFQTPFQYMPVTQHSSNDNKDIYLLEYISWEINFLTLSPTENLWIKDRKQQVTVMINKTKLQNYIRMEK